MVLPLLQDGVRGRHYHPINAETPNNHTPSFASLKHHGNHGSKPPPLWIPASAGMTDCARNDIGDRNDM